MLGRLVWILGVTCWMAVMLPAQEKGLDEMIQKAIDTFEQVWMPPRDELRGLTVVIDPAGSGEGPSDERQRNEMALLTSSHLFHLIERAGGCAVVTRADDRPRPMLAGTLQESLLEHCRQARAHLLVGIVFSDGGSLQADAGGGTPLMKVLADACGSAKIVPESAVGGQLPSAVIHFPMADPAMKGVDPRRIHQSYAEKIYRGIAAYALAHRDELDAARSKRWPAPRGYCSKPFFSDREQERNHRVSELARTIWPEGNLPAARAGWFTAIFRRMALSDSTMVYYSPKTTTEDGVVVLSGATNAPVLRDTLEMALQSLGLNQVRNEMRLLPDERKLGGKLFGTCSATMALTFLEPTEKSNRETQLFYGELVYLLDRDAGFYLVQASDGYRGWVREDCIQTLDRVQFSERLSARQGVFIANLELERRRIPRGTRLPVLSVGERVTLQTPEGQTLEVPSDRVQVVDLASQLEDRARHALQMLYRPYVYAGRSPIGPDCSGLVTNVCENEGTPVARDAAQQYLSGKLVATWWYRDSLRAGDRVYFLDATGKISHTGIAISSSHFVHSSPPCVQISSLKKGDRLYNEDWDHRFLGAKRP